jgi:hypothetical protein
MTTKGKPCRNHGYTNNVKVRTIEPIPETFHTGFCLTHVKALNFGPIPIWRPHHADNRLVRVFVQLEVS